MPSPPDRNPRRRRRSALPPAHIPDRPWLTKESDVAKWYAGLHPLEHQVPSRHRLNNPPSIRARLKDMIRGGYVVVRNQPTMKGIRVRVDLTPRGINGLMMNDFIIGTMDWKSVPKERKEHYTDAYIRDVLYGMIHLPFEQRFNYRRPLSEDEVVERISEDLDLNPYMQTLIHRFGKPAKWPASARSFYRMLERRLLVASHAFYQFKHQNDWLRWKGLLKKQDLLEIPRY